MRMRSRVRRRRRGGGTGSSTRDTRGRAVAGGLSSFRLHIMNEKSLDDLPPMIFKHCLQVVDGLRAHDWQQRMFATRRLEGLVLSRGGERLQPNPTTRDPAHLPPWQQWGVEGEEGGAGGLGQDARPHWAMPGQPHRPLRPVSQFKIFRPKT